MVGEIVVRVGVDSREMKFGTVIEVGWLVVLSTKVKSITEAPLFTHSSSYLNN